jgi:hypothetical protein
MDEFKRVLIRGIGVGFAVVGFGGFVVGTSIEIAPWLLIGVSASLIAFTLLTEPKE